MNKRLLWFYSQDRENLFSFHSNTAVSSSNFTEELSHKTICETGAKRCEELKGNENCKAV